MEDITMIMPNKVDENKQFLIFKQIKAYFNFRNWFLNKLKKNEIDDKVYQNEFYLIDNNWFQNWKKHVGYNDIREHFKNKQQLNDNDYYNNEFVKSVIKYCSVGNPLLPFDNKNIFNNGEINPLADFIIVNKEFIELICPNYKKQFVKEIISYPIKFYKEKLIVYLNNKTMSILFKIDENKYWELIIYFIEENQEKNYLLVGIGNSDIIKNDDNSIEILFKNNI